MQDKNIDYGNDPGLTFLFFNRFSVSSEGFLDATEGLWGIFFPAKDGLSNGFRE